MDQQKTAAELHAQTSSGASQVLGYSTFPLPSRGLFYGDRMPGGLVQQRRMMAGEQARLQQQGGSPLEKIEAIVHACTRLPAGMNPKELLLVDSFFLMLALRTRSFGPEYVYTYRCRQCGGVSKAKVDIQADLEEKAPAGDAVEPFDVTLVDLPGTVQCRFLRLSDQDLISKHVKRTKMTTVDGDDPSYQHRLALSLVSHAGKPFESLLNKQDFIRGLTAADCLRLERGIDDQEPGVDIRVYPDCGSCGASNELAMPFDAEFFRPSRV